MIHLQSYLEKSYQKKISSGRSYPFKTQESCIRNALKYNKSGNLRFSRNGKPIPNPIENIYFNLGRPLPSVEITDRIHEFQLRLAELFPSPRILYPNQPEEFHITFFDYRWERESKNPSPHPLLDDPQKVQKFIIDVNELIRAYGRITIYFKELALFDNGVIVACGYPQDFPQGFPGLSSIDLVREGYLAKFPEAVKYPNITHLTVGRFLRQITEREHNLILHEIDDFNCEPLGSITFSKVRVIYETRFWSSEVRSLAGIDLDSATVAFDPAVRSIPKKRLRKFKKEVREALALADPKATLFQKVFDLTGIHDPQHKNIFTTGREALQAFLQADPAEKLEFYKRFKRCGFGYTYEARFVNLSTLLLNLLQGNATFNFSAVESFSGPYRNWFEDEWLKHTLPFPLPRIGKILKRLRAGGISLCDIGSSCKREGSPTLNLLKQVLSSAFGDKINFHGVDQVRDKYWSIAEQRFVDNPAYQQIGPTEYVNNGIRYHDYTLDGKWDLMKNPLPESFDIITCTMLYPLWWSSPLKPLPKTYPQKMICIFSSDKFDLYKEDKTELPPIVSQNGEKEEIFVAGKEGTFLKNLLHSLKDGGILIFTPFFFKNEAAHRNNCDVHWVIERQGNQFVIWESVLPFQCNINSKFGNGDVVRIALEIQDEKVENSYTLMNEANKAALLRISQKLHFLKYLDVPHRERLGGSQYRDCAEAFLRVLTEEKKDGDISPLLYLLLKEFLPAEEVKTICTQNGLAGIEAKIDEILEQKGFKDFEKVIFGNPT